MQAVERRSYTQIIRLLAERSTALLAAPEVDDEYSSWVRSLEETYGVNIKVETHMGPDNRPSSIDGVISGDGGMPSGFEWAFRIDRHETRFGLRSLDS